MRFFVAFDRSRAAGSARLAGPRPPPRAPRWRLPSGPLAFVVAAVALLPATGCHGQSAQASTRVDADATSGATITREEHVGDTRVLEIYNRGANGNAPLVVCLHGRGGTPDQFARLWLDYPDAAEIALPQAPFPFHDGFSWFDWPPGASDDDLAVNIDAAARRLWPAIAELAHGRKIIVTGFSQGGVLSYALAARHADAIALAVPISGGLPSKLRPRGHTPAAPVYALHGTSDPVVPIIFARATVAAFHDDGAEAELHVFPGIAHTITPEMRDDVWAHVHAALASAPKR